MLDPREKRQGFVKSDPISKEISIAFDTDYEEQKQKIRYFKRFAFQNVSKRKRANLSSLSIPAISSVLSHTNLAQNHVISNSKRNSAADPKLKSKHANNSHQYVSTKHQPQRGTSYTTKNHHSKQRRKHRLKSYKYELTSLDFRSDLDSKTSTQIDQKKSRSSYYNQFRPCDMVAGILMILLMFYCLFSFCLIAASSSSKPPSQVAYNSRKRLYKNRFKLYYRRRNKQQDRRDEEIPHEQTSRKPNHVWIKILEIWMQVVNGFMWAYRSYIFLIRQLWITFYKFAIVCLKIKTVEKVLLKPLFIIIFASLRLLVDIIIVKCDIVSITKALPAVALILFTQVLVDAAQLFLNGLVWIWSFVIGFCMCWICLKLLCYHLIAWVCDQAKTFVNSIWFFMVFIKNFVSSKIVSIIRIFISFAIEKNFFSSFEIFILLNTASLLVGISFFEPLLLLSFIHVIVGFWNCDLSFKSPKYSAIESRFYTATIPISSLNVRRLSGHFPMQDLLAKICKKQCLNIKYASICFAGHNVWYSNEYKNIRHSIDEWGYSDTNASVKVKAFADKDSSTGGFLLGGAKKRRREIQDDFVHISKRNLNQLQNDAYTEGAKFGWNTAKECFKQLLWCIGIYVRAACNDTQYKHIQSASVKFASQLKQTPFGNPPALPTLEKVLNYGNQLLGNAAGFIASTFRNALNWEGSSVILKGGKIYQKNQFLVLSSIQVEKKKDLEEEIYCLLENENFHLDYSEGTENAIISFESENLRAIGLEKLSHSLIFDVHASKKKPTSILVWKNIQEFLICCIQPIVNTLNASKTNGNQIDIFQIAFFDQIGHITQLMFKYVVPHNNIRDKEKSILKPSATEPALYATWIGGENNIKKYFFKMLGCVRIYHKKAYNLVKNCKPIAIHFKLNSEFFL